MKGDFQITRIKAENKGALTLMSDVLKVAHEKLPDLRAEAENRIEFRNMQQAMSAFGKYANSDGFDPTRTFQHVASFSQPVWQMVVDMFARYDEDGNLMDDGLLYKTIEGRLQLNKPFFYALLSYLEGQGIPCDMRGKIKLT